MIALVVTQEVNHKFLNRSKAVRGVDPAKAGVNIQPGRELLFVIGQVQFQDPTASSSLRRT